MVLIENTEINNLEEAYDFLKEKYKNYPYDIWYEKKGIHKYIYIEDIYDSVNYQKMFISVKEVKEFVESGGFENK